MRVSTLEREVESRQREIEQLRSHLQQLQGEMANLMTSQQKVEKVRERQREGERERDYFTHTNTLFSSPLSESCRHNPF